MRSAVFQADPEGFRAQNLGRPPAHLVRELIQNVFDEQATGLNVILEHVCGKGVQLTVVDDVPGGIRDMDLVSTIWGSDKQDSPTKRGRLGRGLKELISVSEHTLIVTERQRASEFVRHRKGNWEHLQPRKLRPKSGTVIEARVKIWNASDLKAIEAHLKQMRPPSGLTFTVNGDLVKRQSADEIHELKLPTVLFVDEHGERSERERIRDTNVELFAEATPWVYEMGIPIEEIDFPLSIDVLQRVPLRDRRDTLTERYRKELFAKLLNVRIDKVPNAELRETYAMRACEAGEHLSLDSKKRIMEVWTEGRPYATTREVQSEATGWHIPVAPTRSMPASVRAVVTEVGTDVRDVLAEAQRVECREVPRARLTGDERRTVEVFEWLSTGVERTCVVKVRDGRPSAEADFDPVHRQLSLYRENLGAEWFRDPFGAEQLGLLIHELAHWESRPDEHGLDFHADSEEVGGQVAAFLFAHADEAAERWS